MERAEDPRAGHRGLGLSARLAALVAALATLGLVTASVQAGSPLRSAPAPKLLTPGTAAIVKSKHLRVAVRVPKVRATVFRATLGSRDITSRFRSRRRGVRRAVIRRLEPGRHTLTVRLVPTARHVSARTANLVDTTEIYVLSKSKRRLLAVGRVGPLKGPIRVRPRQPFRQASGDKRAIRVIGATINGRRARGSLGRWGWAGRPRALRISSSFGIRHGRNVVRITAARESGAYDSRQRVIVIPRGRPIAGAGRDRRALAGRSIRLDGTDSARSPAGKGRLHYRWRVISRPKGSKRVLRNPRSARPRLVTRRAGRYRIQLTVRQRVRGRTVGSANRDVVTIAAAPVTTAAGLPFETIAQDSGSGNLAVRVGDQLYDYPTTGTSVLGYTVMAFDAETLEQTYEFTPSYQVAGPCQPSGDQCNQVIQEAGGSIPSSSDWASIPTDQLGPSGLVYWIAAQAQLNGRPQIVVVVGAWVEQWISSNPNGLANLEVIGGPADGLQDPGQNTPFSFVGVTNATAGTAWWNTTTGSSVAPGNRGDIAGNLAPGSASLFTYVPQDAIPFDTNTTGASSGATAVTATVGDQTVQGSCGQGGSGFLAAILNADSGYVSKSDSFCVNGGSDLENETQVLEMSNFVNPAPGQLLLLQTIGSVEPPTGTVAGRGLWQELGNRLEGLGGLELQDALNSVNGGYTLLAAPGAEPDIYWSGQQPGPAVVGTRLQGLLVRANDGRLEPGQDQPVPDLAAAGIPPDQWDSYLAGFELQQVAIQAPTAWPGDQNQQAAVQWISKTLGFDQAPDPSYGGQLTYNVRNYYDSTTYDLASAIELDPGFSCPDVNTQLDASYGPLAGTTFTPQDCSTALAQLQTESTRVGNVWKLVNALQSPLSTSQTSISLLFTSVAQTFAAAVADYDNSLISYNWQDFAGGGLDALGSFLDPFEGLDVITAVIGVAASAFYISDQFGTDSNGIPLTTVAESLSTLADDANSQFLAAVGGFQTLGAVIVADSAKLAAVGDGVATEQPDYYIPSDQGTLQDANKVLVTAYKRELVPGMLAALNPYAWELPTTSMQPLGGTQGWISVATMANNDPPDVNYWCNSQQPFYKVNPATVWSANAFTDGQRQFSVLSSIDVSAAASGSDTLPMPASATNGIFGPPDGDPGTLASGLTPAELLSDPAFTAIGADAIQSGCNP
jgi:hypothetical protein